MEEVVGLIIVIVVAVLGWDGTDASPARRPPTRSAAPPPRPVAGSAAATRLVHDREIRRHQRADAAFFDGVIFSHYFLNGNSEQDEADDGGAWDEGLHDDDGYWD